jgi:hypothetical protein
MYTSSHPVMHITQFLLLHLWSVLILFDMTGKQFLEKCRAMRKLVFTYECCTITVVYRCMFLLRQSGYVYMVNVIYFLSAGDKNRYCLKILGDCCRVWPPAVNRFGGKVLKLHQIVYICVCFCDMKRKWLMSIMEWKIRTASVHASWLTRTHINLVFKPSHFLHFSLRL